MSTLGDLLRSRTPLSADEVDRLHALVAEWQLVSDLSFADLVLWVRTGEGEWLAGAHIRPTTGPTVYAHDVVGAVRTGRDAARLERARREGRAVREREPDRSGSVAVRREAVPVPGPRGPIAIVSRDAHVAVGRTPSPLELAYLSSAGELLQMLSEGSFPYPRRSADPETGPRVGDGLVRLDRTGHVVYASPNAQSACRRLGVAGPLLGTHLGSTLARLPVAAGEKDEPRVSAALSAVLQLRESRDAEVEARGATVLLRAMPLVPGGEPRGALVLVRDVTELRRRDRQLIGKDATIREIHHRVKNNLQTVAALLRLQARRLPDDSARAALEESVRRVASIALVHETLSLSADETVAFDGVADRVLAMCTEVGASQTLVRAHRTGTAGLLPAEVATPLSLVVAELVQNALEHGLADRPGSVDLRLERHDGRLRVLVSDDGAGLPLGFDLARHGRLGLQIVRTLVEGELRGTLQVHASDTGGTCASVDVPVTG